MVDGSSNVLGNETVNGSSFIGQNLMAGGWSWIGGGAQVMGTSYVGESSYIGGSETVVGGITSGGTVSGEEITSNDGIYAKNYINTSGSMTAAGDMNAGGNVNAVGNVNAQIVSPANYLQLASNATLHAGCPSNGAVSSSSDGSGTLMSCVNGSWSTVGGSYYETEATWSGLGMATPVMPSCNPGDNMISVSTIFGYVQWTRIALCQQS
jgi:predicted acyltransferase (DUF342 family)